MSSPAAKMRNPFADTPEKKWEGQEEVAGLGAPFTEKERTSPDAKNSNFDGAISTPPPSKTTDHDLDGPRRSSRKRNSECLSLFGTPQSGSGDAASKTTGPPMSPRRIKFPKTGLFPKRLGMPRSRVEMQQQAAAGDEKASTTVNVERMQAPSASQGLMTEQEKAQVGLELDLQPRPLVPSSTPVLAASAKENGVKPKAKPRPKQVRYLSSGGVYKFTQVHTAEHWGAEDLPILPLADIRGRSRAYLYFMNHDATTFNTRCMRLFRDGIESYMVSLLRKATMLRSQMDRGAVFPTCIEEFGGKDLARYRLKSIMRSMSEEEADDACGIFRALVKNEWNLTDEETDENIELLLQKFETILGEDLGWNYLQQQFFKLEYQWNSKRYYQSQVMGLMDLNEYAVHNDEGHFVIDPKMTAEDMESITRLTNLYEENNPISQITDHGSSSSSSSTGPNFRIKSRASLETHGKLQQTYNKIVSKTKNNSKTSSSSSASASSSSTTALLTPSDTQNQHRMRARELILSNPMRLQDMEIPALSSPRDKYAIRLSPINPGVHTGDSENPEAWMEKQLAIWVEGGWSFTDRDLALMAQGDAKKILCKNPHLLPERYDQILEMFDDMFVDADCSTSSDDAFDFEEDQIWLNQSEDEEDDAGMETPFDEMSPLRNAFAEEEDESGNLSPKGFEFLDKKLFSEPFTAARLKSLEAAREAALKTEDAMRMQAVLDALDRSEEIHKQLVREEQQERAKAGLKSGTKADENPQANAGDGIGGGALSPGLQKMVDDDFDMEGEERLVDPEQERVLSDLLNAAAVPGAVKSEVDSRGVEGDTEDAQQQQLRGQGKKKMGKAKGRPKKAASAKPKASGESKKGQKKNKAGSPRSPSTLTDFFGAQSVMDMDVEGLQADVLVGQAATPKASDRLSSLRGGSHPDSTNAKGWKQPKIWDKNDHGPYLDTPII
ncbi:unnamed protein product [Amoebophrya sp. A25]|nr:unnamed protein product [Amoebophrya sp. A25]|eukprot:GSA25T00019220001.1